ncbi:MAG TPA: ABC transporter permease, partial [Cellvibrionaceae bacterium]
MSASLAFNVNPLMVSLFLKNCIKAIALPFVGLAVFLLLWEFGSSKVHTSLGQFPGPAIVLNQAQGLYQEYKEDKASAGAFYERQEKRFAQARAQDANYVAEYRQYSGKPTFIQQIFTSLKTVFTGFLLASLIAIPL